MNSNSGLNDNWWMYHGDAAHTGYTSTSAINSGNAHTLTTLHTLTLGGPILSVPAVVDGFVYVGTANSRKAIGANGGSFYKINIITGEITNTFTWSIPLDERDTHSFTGMGCTPAVIGGKVYFVAFNGKLYCLDQQTFQAVWITDLRNADPIHNQPVANLLGEDGAPPAAGWSSPLVVGNRVYLGMGEGENPDLYSFVYCLDTATGNVIWMYCTCKFEANADNSPNVVPAEAVPTSLPGYTLFPNPPITKGCSIWASIAYDADLNRLYIPTGNPQPEPKPPLASLPSAGYSNGLLSLDATTGDFKGFFQVPLESNYRVTDTDIDIGASPTVFTRSGRKIVGIGCKNGSYFLLDADTLQLISYRQLLPLAKDGTQLPSVDSRVAGDGLTAEQWNAANNDLAKNIGENFFGIYSTAAVDSAQGRIFVGLGGPNYHTYGDGMTAVPGIDYLTTPFMRALDWNTLADAWPVDNNEPPRYARAMPPMFTNAGECGLSSPAIINDVVFCSTSNISLYAFAVADGSLLWQDDLGSQTQGYSGGYGYCMGPAVWGNYVVAGALITSLDGGILNIYGLPMP